MRVKLGQAWRDRQRVIHPSGTVLDLDEATAAELIGMRWATSDASHRTRAGEPPGGDAPPSATMGEAHAAPPGGVTGDRRRPAGAGGRHGRRDMRAEE
jgi:hypothetical protein